MLELLDLSANKSKDVTSVNDSHASSNITVSNEQFGSDSTNTKCTPLNIKLLLKQKPEKYFLVYNPRISYDKSFACRHRFALSAIQNENKKTVTIKNFATC